ncbi:Aurora kinase A- and ninein-interacting protein [Trichinella pseudospiralis]
MATRWKLMSNASRKVCIGRPLGEKTRLRYSEFASFPSMLSTYSESFNGSSIEAVLSSINALFAPLKYKS